MVVDSASGTLMFVEQFAKRFTILSRARAICSSVLRSTLMQVLLQYDERFTYE